MEAGVKRPERIKARRGHAKPNLYLEVAPDQPDRKLRLTAISDDTVPDFVSKKLRTAPDCQDLDVNPKTANKRLGGRRDCFQHRPSRKDPYLREIQDSNDQRGAQSIRRTRSSRNNTREQVGQNGPQPVPRGLKVQEKAKRQRVDEDSELSQDAKRRKPSHVTRQPVTDRKDGTKDFIEDWLSETCRSRRSSIDNDVILPNLLDSMPPNPTKALPSPGDSLSRTASSSRKSEKTTASVHDVDYRQSLNHRNIFIEREDPPAELMSRALAIISQPRASPEMDDGVARELKNKIRSLQDEAENVFEKQLAPDIIPAVVPNSKFVSNSDQQWFKSVPLPLNPDCLISPLPLPKPKPDLAFGFSEGAFTRKQRTTIDLLVEDQFGRSYAIPNQKLRFPFLDIEFKSQAKNGTHYVATNQAAGAGAIALNGYLDLIRRSFGLDSFDFDEPRFFSISIDHELARINVHWMRTSAEDAEKSFHVEGLSRHLLSDANGIRALRRAIKNILDHVSREPLENLCTALDAYRKRVLSGKEAVAPKQVQENSDKADDVPPEPRRRGKRGQPPGTEEVLQTAEEVQGTSAVQKQPAKRRSRRTCQ